MVVEARRLVDSGEIKDDDDDVVHALNALGYEQAARHVYGMHYKDWKAQHQKKATEEQMERYFASSGLHALHDKDLLEARGDAKTVPKIGDAAKQHTSDSTTESAAAASATPLASNVCCQEEEVPAGAPAPAEQPKQPAKMTRQIGPFQPPPIPTTFHRTPTIAVLTISDRAAAGEYATGDQSGPAVTRAVEEVTRGYSPAITVLTAIVPDDSAAIQAKLTTWSDAAHHDVVDLILTTGGTGFGPRDVTPEATREVLEHELSSLMAFLVTESSHLQPLASLSRGTAGIRRGTVIANLPGNPQGVQEMVPLLLPLLLHAVVDLQEPDTPEVLAIE